MHTESVFCLDVFVEDLTCLASGHKLPARRQEAIACRFLDYPTFFIYPRCIRDENACDNRSSILKFHSGKSCVLAEIPEQLQGLTAQVRTEPNEISTLGII